MDSFGVCETDVPRYLKDRTYAEGWEDGFRQCKAMRENEDLNRRRSRTTRLSSVTDS